MADLNGTAVFELRLSPVYLSVYVTIHSILVFNIILGNAVVISTVTSIPRPTPNNIFLCSLAFADLFTGAIAIAPTLIARVVVSYFTCIASSRILLFTPIHALCSISVLHLMVLTVDRYLAISRPLKYRLIMTTSRCRAILAAIWTFGLIFAAVPMLGVIASDQWVCGTVNYESETVSIHALVVAAMPPSVSLFLLLFYVRIFVIANRHVKGVSQTRRTGSMGEEAVLRLEAKSRMRATVTTVLVVAVFGICWFPISVKVLVELYTETSEEVQFVYQTLAEVLGMSNSALNPIIYAIRNKQYRKTYRRFLRAICPFCRSKHDPEELSRSNGNMSSKTISTEI